MDGGICTELIRIYVHDRMPQKERNNAPQSVALTHPPKVRRAIGL